MDWDSLRRIVTANDAADQSVYLLDGGAAKTLSIEEAGLAEIWSASLDEDILADEDRLAEKDVRLEPDHNHVKVRWFTVASEDETQTTDEREAAAAFGFAAAGATHTRVDSSRHPKMHKTDTLDVIILVKGSVALLLDEGAPKTLKPGDVVIQKATNHAWVNHGDETALLVAVLINAKEK